jgi:hypothetical protein
MKSTFEVALDKGHQLKGEKDLDIFSASIWRILSCTYPSGWPDWANFRLPTYWVVVYFG